LRSLTLSALPGIGEINPGDDLGGVLCGALIALGLTARPHDVLVVTQKVVSKAEDRYVSLDTVQVSPRAAKIAAATGKDPRLVELVLAESTEVLRADERNILIVRHRLGFVMANAGIDRSNVPGTDRVLLLPRDPDSSAARLRSSVAERFGVEQIGVVISDSFGRPWRKGITHVALGAAGLPSLLDRRGEQDRGGRELQVTEVAMADLLASAAGLLMGEGAEGLPAVLIRGITWTASSAPASALIRPIEEDLFR
jgi:coenzyme F420-0:L-glutamate ligase/coenzyme F420-1:gamma-L-glutamate ligase